MEHEPFDLSRVVELNRTRLTTCFTEAQQSGSAWLVECRDLGDAHDQDAGVYFEPCGDEAAVDELVQRCSDNNRYNRLLGIFNLHKPLAPQGSGISRPDWLAGRR